MHMGNFGQENRTELSFYEPWTFDPSTSEKISCSRILGKVKCHDEQFNKDHEFILLCHATLSH